MGKQTQSGQINGMTQHNKTNPNFKWGRMFHLLDYHHWHYIKKVLANKKCQEAARIKDVESVSPADVSNDINTSSTQEVNETPQLPEHQSTESSSPPAMLPPKRPPSLSTSASTKNSRATKIKKMIAREVSKRKNRHRRSSTCPVNSDLVTTDLEHNEEGIVTTDNIEMSRHDMGEAGKTCGLCDTMKIECQLGDKKQVAEQGELSLNHVNMNLHENSNDNFKQLHLYKNIRRSVSLQQSSEFLDVTEDASANNGFFLRILDDRHGCSVRSNDSSPSERGTTTSSTITKRKPLTRSETFPVNDPSRKDNPINGLKQNPKAYKHAILEKQTSLHDVSQVPRLRFKDLRHKIKHVIKESKKDRHIIAMDAVLHKVPYGKKVPEEATTSPSPSLSPCRSVRSLCETDYSFSQDKDMKTSYKRRSPSLDGSLDKYCHLFETTSFGKEAKTDIHKEPKLSVNYDDNLTNNKSEQKRLARMFSSPDLHLFLTNRYDDASLRTPNRRMLSFREDRGQDILDMDLEYRNRFSSVNDDQEEEEIASKKGSLEELDDGIISNEENSIEMQHCQRDDDCATNTQLVLNMESLKASKVGDDVHQMFHETTIQGPNMTQEEEEETSQPRDISSSDSPTFSCIKVDEDGENTSSERYISPSLHLVHIELEDIEEYKYVKNILQLSGYLDNNEPLGQWYSSEQPIGPTIFIEFESKQLLDSNCSLSKGSNNNNNNHLLLFDLTNETLLAIYERSISYWCAPLCSCSRMHPMPKGYHILDQVWTCIHWYITCSKPQLDPSLDYITTRDLAKDDKWMNLQFDAECVGIEVEELLFEDLINEVIS